MEGESEKEKKEVIIDLNSEFNLSKPSIFNKEFSSVLLAPILIGVILIIYGVYYYFEGKPFNDRSLVTEVSDSTPSPSTNTQPTATQSALKKEEIKIQVLNGSGVAGQAGRARDSLVKLGFKNIETGNDPNADGEKTLVNYTSQVGPDTLNEILNELKRSFKNISEEQSKLDDFDIVIVTGK